MNQNNEIFHKCLSVSHMLVTQKLQEGDLAIDATMGNGHDTIFLAQIVGASGRVIAFDIQPRALDKTQARLKDHQFQERVTLILDSHSKMDQHVEGEARIVMFNLGFLPQSEDKTIVTRVETTILAIEKASQLLAPGGLVIVVIYPGHPEGAVEKKEVMRFASQLPQNQYNVFCVDLFNQINDPPILVGIEKKV